jgi:hypothetical protein
MPGPGQHKGRVVMKAISTSQKVASLRSPWHKLLYTWLIPHADNLGRLEGDPMVIRSMIFPRERKVQPAMVRKWLDALHRARLICWFDRDGDRYIQIHNFTKMNPPRGNMTLRSDIPPAPRECSTCGDHSPCSNVFESVSPEYECECEGECECEREAPADTSNDEGVGARALPQRTAQQLISTWNAMVDELPKPVRISKVLKITPGTDRHRGARSRIADGMLEHWDAILKEVKRSAFLQGGGKAYGKFSKPFVISLDWLLCHKGNWVKVAEGKFRDQDPSGGTGDLFTDTMAEKEI